MPQFTSSNTTPNINEQPFDFYSNLFMKLNIHETIILTDVSDEDKKTLQFLNVYFKDIESELHVIEQKITLPFHKSEKILDIFDEYAPGNITLQRYEAGRYILKMN